MDSYDTRAAGAGILLGGAGVLLFLAGETEVTTGTLIDVLVMSILLLAPPVGAVVGYLSKSYRGAFIEGGVATPAGVLLGLLAWSTLEAATLDGATLAERVDVYFVIAGTVGVPFAAIGPAQFIVGGVVASKVDQLRNSAARSIDDELEQGLFER